MIYTHACISLLCIITKKHQKHKKRVVHQKQKITKLKVRMRTFCFHFPKQNSEIDIPLRGPPPAKPPYGGSG